MKRLVIFDLDGTLLNTIEDLGTATNYAMRQCGYPEHNLSVYPLFVGNGVAKLIERALPAEVRSPAEIARARSFFTEYYDVHCADATRPYPGIEQVVSALSSRGIGLAVASNKYQAAVDRLVYQFFPDARWLTVQGNREGVPSKPDPSIIFQILTDCPTPKGEVLYVGDSGVDMETARRACVESVGVSWGFRSVKELKEHYADHIISDPDDLLSLVNQN